MPLANLKRSQLFTFLVAAIMITGMLTACSETRTSSAAESTLTKIITQPPPDLQPTASVTPHPSKTLTPLLSATPSSFPAVNKTTETIAPDKTFYTAQPGDTLSVVARRFGVEPGEIISSVRITPQTLIKNGQELIIPVVLSQDEFGPAKILLPDTEIIHSRSTLDFDAQGYIQSAGGYFSTYREYLKLSGWHTGSEIVTRVAYENAINPRLLIALLEYQSHWIYNPTVDDESLTFPLRYSHPNETGLYRQLTWAAGQIAEGYYGWRDGSLGEIKFSDDSSLHPAPNLNAGTVALQVLFSKLYPPEEWGNALYGEQGFVTRYGTLFGDYNQRDQVWGPIYTHDLSQPDFLLPFQPKIPWNFTSGPHPPWRLTGALAALDFAPSGIIDCEPTGEWVTAVAAGLVVRSANGVVALDLDGDGYEQTGWVVVYVHIAIQDRVEMGTLVTAGSPIGRPSCEGGLSTGAHVHIARKYNGEWIPAGGPVPFELGGWIAKNNDEPYQGYLIKDDLVITANRFGTHESQISWLLFEPAEHNEFDLLNP